MIKKILSAAIYARKSNDDDYKCSDNKSITRQIEHGKSYATKKGWTVSDENIFTDDGISGAEFKNRPGLIGLRKRISEYDVIIMSELSRLGRDGDRTSFEVIDFIENGKRIFYYLTDEEEKANDATSKIMLRLKSFAAEIEREKASQRVTDALHRRAEKGYVASGPAYGYDIVPIEAISSNGEKVKSHSEYRINKKEEEIVIAIFKMY
ncbi:recombinase family protein, partial [Altibacter sp.]|uniref:recombinase family protein n=1 Tax=Altibacter sp. TaxID=2024823 RepID=UPI00258A8090